MDFGIIARTSREDRLFDNLMNLVGPEAEGAALSPHSGLARMLLAGEGPFNASD